MARVEIVSCTCDIKSNSHDLTQEPAFMHVCIVTCPNWRGQQSFEFRTSSQKNIQSHAYNACTYSEIKGQIVLTAEISHGGDQTLRITGVIFSVAHRMTQRTAASLKLGNRVVP